MNLLGFLFGESLEIAALSMLMIIAAGYVVGRVLKFFFHFLRRRLAERTRTSLDDFLLLVAARLAVPLAVISTAYWSSGDLPAHAVGRTILLQQLATGVHELAYVFLVLAIALSCARFVDAVIRWYLKDVAVRTETHLDDELAPLFNRILNTLVFAVAIIIILDHYHQNISTLVVSLGVGSLAIALAAQDTLANMVAGFVLMIDRPFRIGDRVRLPNGVLGNVHEIGLRSTKIIDDSNVMNIMPNAEIVKSQIANLSYPDDVVRFTISFGIAYGTDVDMVQRAVIGAVNAQPDIVDPDTTEVRLIDLAESALRLDLFCKIRTPSRIPRRKSEILKLIYETLGANGVVIPFPQRVVHMASETSRSKTTPVHPS